MNQAEKLEEQSEQTFLIETTDLPTRERQS